MDHYASKYRFRPDFRWLICVAFSPSISRGPSFSLPHTPSPLLSSWGLVQLSTAGSEETDAALLWEPDRIKAESKKKRDWEITEHHRGARASLPLSFQRWKTVAERGGTVVPFSMEGDLVQICPSVFKSSAQLPSSKWVQKLDCYLYYCQWLHYCSYFIWYMLPIEHSIV